MLQMTELRVPCDWLVSSQGGSERNLLSAKLCVSHCGDAQKIQGRRFEWIELDSQPMSRDDDDLVDL